MSNLIDRQAAIAEFSRCELTPDGGIDANDAIDILTRLPSIQPSPCEFCKHNDMAADGICLRCVAERRGG